jgi:hypothetical protein
MPRDSPVTDDGTGPDLEDDITGRDLPGLNDLAKLVVIVKEVLAQPIAGRQSARRQQFFDFGQRLHGRSIR